MARQRTTPPLPIVGPSVREDKKFSGSKVLGSMSNWFTVLVIVLPILFSQQTMDPVLSVRYLFLSGFTLLFLLFFLTYKQQFAHIFLPAAVKRVFIWGGGYGAWCLLVLFFAINPATALYEIARFFMNIGVLFLITVVLIREKSCVANLCKAITITALIQSAVAMLQFYDLAFTWIPGTDKPYGLMVHRTLLGSAQVLLLPFVLFTVYRGKTAWRYFGVIVLACTITSIIISQARSAWIALLVAATVLFILSVTVFWKFRQRLLKMTVAGAGAVVAITVVLFLSDKTGSFSTSFKKRISTFVQPTSDYNRASSGRLLLWSNSLKLLRDHPVVGVGPGNWPLAIPLYTQKNAVWTYDQLAPSWPHNVYVQTACETGIPGLLLYLGFWGSILVTGYRTILKSADRNVRVLNMLMLCGLAAFATDSMFSFPTERIEHCLYAVTMSGIILGSYASLPLRRSTAAQPVKQWVLLPIVFILALNLFIGYKKYNFEKHMSLAKYYRKEKSYAEVIREVEEGKSSWVTLDPNGEPLEIQSSAAYIELNDYPNALAEIQKAAGYHPNSGRLWATMGVAYANMQQYGHALECYRKALACIPNYDLALKNMAVIYFKSGNYAACVETLKKIHIYNKTVPVEYLLAEAQRRLKDSTTVK